MSIHATKPICKVILITIFTTFATTLPAQLQFNILEATLEAVPVDGTIDFNLQLSNVSKRKAQQVYPLGDGLSAFIKSEDDSTWRYISIMRICSLPSRLKMRPGQHTGGEVNLKHSFPLEPDKTYYLMLFYTPSVIGENEPDYNLFSYYFQNHPGISRHNKYLSDHTVLRTEKLTGVDLNAWNQLKRDTIIKYYMENTVGSITPTQFEKLEQFLKIYPDSRFSGRIKAVFVHYFTRREIKMSNLQFEKSMEYIKELNTKERILIPDWEIDLIRNKKQEN